MAGWKRTLAQGRDTAEDLAGEVAELRDELATLARSARRQASARFDDFADTSADALSFAAERARDVSARALDSLSSEARANPLRTMAVALAIGLAFGWLSRPRG